MKKKNKLIFSLGIALVPICATMPLISIVGCNKEKEPTPEPEEEVLFEISEGEKFGAIFSTGEIGHIFTFNLSGTQNGDSVTFKLLNQKDTFSGEPSEKVRMKDAATPTAEAHFEISNNQETLDLNIVPNSADPQQEPFDVTFDIEILVNRDKQTIFNQTITGFEFAALVATLDPNMFVINDQKLIGFNSEKQAEIDKCGCLVIPSDVTEIADNAFYDELVGFKYLVLDLHHIDPTAEQSQLQIIGQGSFSDNPSLKGELFIPQNVTTIKSNAFYNCASLGSLTFDESSSLSQIGGGAFKNCSGLSGSIEFPSSLEKIDEQAFCMEATECKGLTSFTFKSSSLNFANAQFWHFPNVDKIFFPNITDPENSISASGIYSVFQCAEVGYILVHPSGITNWAEYLSKKITDNFRFIKGD